MTGRPEAGQRLRRLLAVLTWLARVRRAPVTELADRFAMTPEDLVADLELAACCGLPPYTPDQLMEIIVDDEEVVAELGEDLARPRRLSAAEGFALAAAARAILATPRSHAEPDGAGALERALAKLDAALDAGTRASRDVAEDATDTDDSGGRGGPVLRVDLGDSPHLAVLRRAVEEGRQLAVRYYSLSSDEESDRVIDPFDLLAVDGRWYLDAYCHRADGMRRFRVDRLVAVSETGRPVDHRAPDELPSAEVPAFVPGPDATVATVAVKPEGMWLVETVPTLRVSRRRDGRTEVDLAVASPVWFERLLLRLGPNAEVLRPAELADTGRSAASRLLARYASTESAAR